MCCDVVLIPFNPDFFAAKGIELPIAGLRSRIQPHPLPRLGVFANRVLTRGRPTRLARSWMNDVRSACGQEAGVRYLDTWIPDRAALRDSITSRRTPVELEDRFRTLWQEANAML